MSDSSITLKNYLRNYALKLLIRLLFKQHSTIEQTRARTARNARWMKKSSEDILVENVDMDGLNAEWIREADHVGEKVFLYLHGGGYVTGSPDSHRNLCAALAKSTRMKVLLLEYRLAPEHPFPAALEDTTCAYRWLVMQGFEAENIIIVGDSAGGGLSLAAIQALRDEGAPLPAGVVCISPWTDLSMSFDSHRVKAKAEPVLHADNLRLWAFCYAGAADLRNPLISPAFADFAGFPSLLIQVGGEEVLLDDALKVAESAKTAGVDVTLSVWEGMWHVWHASGSFLPESRAAFEEIGVFVKGIEHG